MPLSEVAVRSAKAKDKPYKLTDGAGLYLYVSKTGARLWRMDYKFNGKNRTLSIGPYPVVGLAEARKRRDAAKLQLLDGVDPSTNKPSDKAKPIPEDLTFGYLAGEYLDRMRHDGRADQTLIKNEWLLKTLAADLKDKAIGKITPADVLAVLRQVEAAGRLESANRLRSAISGVFRLAVATLRTDGDPTLALRGAIKSPRVRNHPAIVDEKRFGDLMRTIDGYDGWPTLTALLKFAALTAARPGEARMARWSELDLDKARWVIPAVRTKMRRDHEVPLSTQAIEVVRFVHQISGRSQFVFPSIRVFERPLSENAMNAALMRMGYTQDEHTPHGFRSSFSTIMNEREFNPEAIERALAHKDSSIRGVYNRSRYWQERVELMQAWADLIDELKKPG